MSNIGRAVLRVPNSIKAGEPFIVKTLIKHPQYNGIIKGDDGKPVPKDFIQTFEVFYGPKRVFSIDSTSALSQNPKLNFWMNVSTSEELKVVWSDNKGNKVEQKKKVKL